MITKRSALIIQSLILLTICTIAAHATSAFEGVIEASTSSDEQNATMVFTVKGSMTRVDVNGQGGGSVILLDREKKLMNILMPSMKMYMQHEMNAPTTATEKPTAKIENSGETETLLDHPCQVWTATYADGTVEKLWLATDVNAYFAFGGTASMKRQDSELEKLAKDKGYFPLKNVKTKDGKTTTFLVTKIEAKTIDASVFVIPEDFKLMSIPSHGH